MGSKALFRFVLTLGLATIGLAVLFGLLTGAQAIVHAAASQPSISPADAQDVARPLPHLEPFTGMAWSLAARPSKAPLLAASASTVITVCKPAGVCDYTSVQAAVSGASDGDVIKVAEGVYTGTSTCVVDIAKTITLQGGYTTTAGAMGWTISDPDGHPTVLDGEGSRQVVCINAGDPTIEGFHVRNGQGTDGAGVYVAGGEPVVRRNRIYGNVATTSGGGVYVVGGSLVLENSLIYANTAVDGGGVYVASGSARIHYNTFYDNEATAGSGGGLHLASGSSPAITASIVVSNVAGSSGGGLFKEADVPGDQVLYNDVFGNLPQNYDGFGGDGNVLVSNIHQAPLFVGPVVVGDLAAANFRLQASSPCIGRDSEDYPDAGPDDDYDGYGRPFGPWPDIGAHEFFTGTCFARLNSGQIFTAVQDAVDAFASGDEEIKVAGYCTDGGPNVVTVAKGLVLRGGYTLTNWSDPDSAVYVTVLDGEGARRVIYANNVDVTIEGFDIFNGYVTGSGGGILVAGGSNSVIRGNRIYSNATLGSSGYGGGVYVQGRKPLVQDNVIYSNTAQKQGGGIYVAGSIQNDVTIENNRIYLNRTVDGDGGGGITLANQNPNQGVATVRSNWIYSNTANVGSGGGIYCPNGSSVIQYNDVYSNTADQSGGGIHTNSSSAIAVTVEGNQIYKNIARGSGSGGGGIYADNVALVRNNAIFSNTTVGRGGGVYAFDATVIVEANRIYSNHADNRGGGVMLRGNALARNNLVYTNTATNDGGGFNVLNGYVENNTIHDNQAVGRGGGIYNEGGTYVRNSIVVNNTSGLGYSGIHGGDIRYSDVWGNSGGVAECNSCVGSNGNIGVDPLFEDASAPDFHLQVGSQCIDTVPNTEPFSVYDYDHYARPLGQYADMGAHEFYAGTCFATLSTGVGAGGRVYTNVQAAVFTATAGVDDVLVAGVCAGNDAMVTIDKSLALRGGYTKSNWLEPSYPTILNAQGVGRVVNVIASSPSTVTVERFVIMSGDAGGGDGGGIYVSTAISPAIQNVTFYSNTAGNGGGFASNGGDPHLYNNTFVYNAATNGGGIYLSGGSPVVSNTIAVSNTGSGIHTVGSSPILAYNNVWGNSGGSNGGYGGGLSQGGPTDFSLPPRFDGLAGPIFRLAFDSPCVHTGDPNTGSTEDFEGDIRPSGDGYDIGADEATDYLGVDLKAEREEDVTTPGRVIQYTYRLTNTGTRVDDFVVNNTLVVDPIAGDTTAGEWQSGSASSYVGLAPGEAVAVPITVAVPTKALSGTQATLSLTATYQSGSGGSIYFFDVASTTILVKADWGVVLEPPAIAQNADPGKVVTHTHTLTNAGGADTFTFTLNSSLGWATVVPPGPVSLGSGGSMPIEIRVTVPTTAAGGIVETTALIANSVEAAGVGRVVRDVVTDTTTVNPLPGDRYVSPDGDDNARYIGDELVRLNSCRNSDYPCGTVAHAVEQAGGGEWVKVAEGVYTEYNISINGAIVVQGGYAPPDWGTFDPDAHPTVIDALALGRVMRIEGGNPIIGGMTLQNGRVSNLNGGGVYVSAAAEPTLRRVVITGNAARSSLSTGGSGGGLYNAGSDLTLERSKIVNNEADRFGGGFYNHTGEPRVWNNLFYDNVADDDGGGFYNRGGNPWVWHDTFVRNAADRGGGLYLYSGSPVVSNTIVVSNTAVVTGGGIYKAATGAALDYNDVAGNVPSQYAGTPGGSHSIEVNPYFMDAAGDDFHLLRDSLCRDSGDGVDPALLAEDMDGQPRTMNVFPDIGADEYQRPDVALVSLDPDQVGDQGEWVTYTHRLTNTGNYDDYYVLTWQSVWSVTVEGQATQPVTVPVLSSNEAMAIVVTVRVPDDVLSGTVKRTVVTATSQVAVSQGETDVYATAASFTTAGRNVAVSLEPDRDGWADQLQSVVYTHTLTNLGNYTDTFSVEVKTFVIPPDTNPWQVDLLSPTSVALAKGESAVVTVRVNVPSFATEVDVNTTLITATSQTDLGVLAVVTDTTVAKRRLGVDLAPDSALADYTDECVVHNHVLTNTGNYTDTYVFTYTSALGWPIKIENTVPPVEVKVGAWPPHPDGPGSTAIEVQVCIPEPPIAFGGQVETMVITATSVSSPALSSAVTDITTATQKEGVELWPDYTYNYDPADLKPADLLGGVRRLVLTTGNQLVTFTHTLKNNTYSNSTDTFTLTHVVGPVAWAAGVSPAVTGEMYWHEETTVTVSLTAEASPIPPALATAATVQVTGTSWFSPTGPHGQAVVEDVVVVNQAVSATLSPGGTRHGPTPPYASPAGLPSPPDGVVVYTHTLTNAGNYTDSFVLDAWSSWDEAVDFLGVDKNDRTPDIGPGMTHAITVEATVPFVRCGTTGTVIITATSRTPNEGLYSYDPVASVQDAIVIDPVYYAELTPAEVVRRYVSTDTMTVDETYTRWLTNWGNCTNTFNLGVQGSFTPTVQPTNTGDLPSFLDAGYNPTLVTVTVTVPQADPSALITGTVEITADGASGGASDFGIVTDTIIINQRVEAAFEPDFTETVTQPGTVNIYHHHVLTNAGNYKDTFLFTWRNGDGWNVWVEGNAQNKSGSFGLTLGAQETKTVEVRVEVGPNVPPTLTNRTWVTVTSQTPELEKELAAYSPVAVVTDTTLVRRPDVTIYPDFTEDVIPGDIHVYTHTLENSGGQMDTYTVTCASLDRGWLLGCGPQKVENLPPGQTQEITVSVAIPLGAEPGWYDVAVVTATSAMSYPVEVYDVATDTTNVLYILEAKLSPTEPRSADPGTTITLTHRLTNTGTYTESFELTTDQEFSDVDVVPQQVDLGPLEWAPVTVTVAIPAYAPAGDAAEQVQVGVYATHRVLGVRTQAGSVLDTVNISHTTGTRHVDSGGTDEGNNCTLRDERPPCRTVQHAVDQASPGDTVKVAGGTYLGAPGATQVVSVSKSIALIGGYVIDDWNTSLPDDRETILDGGNLRRVMVLGTGVTPTIEGFRLSRGYVVGDGAGLYIAEGTTPTVRLNHIFDNTAVGDAESSRGGGVYYGGGDGVIERNSIYGNEADHGGGLYLRSGEPLVQNNLVYDNVSVFGGGFYNYSGVPRIRNDTFYGNAAGSNGAGGLYSLGGRLIVSNTIVAANGDFGIRVAGAASYTLAYNDVWGNERGDYSQVVYTGTGTISEDPRLADPSIDDLRLTFNSPCVDAGDPGVLWPDVDYEGNDRPLRGRHDIGAYEYGFVSTKVVTDASPANTVITYVVQVDNIGNVAHTVVVTDVLHEFLDATGDLTYTTGSGLYSVADKKISWTGLIVSNTVELITFTARITDGVANYTPITNVAWVDQGHTAVVTTTVRPQLGTRYVAPSGDNTNNDCRIMTEPCQTVQYAVGQALDSDEIKVAAGTYTGLVTVTKRITLTGGYAYVNVNNFDWTTFDPNANQTTLDALSGGDPGVTIDSEAVVLAGFHIVNGTDGVNVTAGGDLTLHRSWIYDNGDGVEVAVGTALLVNSVIVQNTGAGLRVAAGSDGIVVHSTFDGNDDGAIVDGTALFTNTIFSDHAVGVDVNATGSASLWNTLWWGNTANWQGTLIHSADVFSDPLFVNSVGMDYHILEDSGAVDQGTVVPWVTEDLDGEARWVREAPDIGADEFPLGLNKYGPPTADPGQLITYTIELKAVDVGLVVTDVLPVHLTYTGTVTCTAPTCAYLAAERAIRWAGDSTEIVLITYTGHLDPWLGKDVVVANTAELLRQGRRDESVAWETVINQVPGTRHVAPGGFDVDAVTGADNNCLVDSMPCRTVQWAVGQAMDGDTIKVAAGTYTSTAAQVVYVNKAITLTGGCTTAGWACDPEVYSTYLDGQDSRRVMYIANTPGTVAVDGFHLINGSVADNGSGIRVSGVAVMLTRNRIHGNTAFGASGGGIALFNTDATLEGNWVYDNTATGGNNGGGAYVWDTDTVMDNNVIVANQAGNGDGLFFDGFGGNYVRMRHNTIADNLGEGVYVGTFTLAMTDTIVSGHPGDGVRNQGGSVVANYTLWYGNGDDWSGAVTDNGPLTPGDPRFVDPGSYDYHIRPDSAAFDQGVDAGMTTDIDGDDRPMGLGFDVGADELRVSLDVIKWAEPDPVQAEDPLTYTIRITNTGQLTLTATITDILPLDVTPNTPVVWTSVIIPGAVWTDDVGVQTQIAGQLTNVVKVTTAEGATGIFTETSVVTSTPDIVVTPPVLSEMLAPGGTAQRTLTIGNVGRAALNWSLAEVPMRTWLSETPAGGPVPPSGHTDVTVGFDATGLTDGQTYTTTLRISSNDLETPEVDVSTVLTVCTPVSGLSFTYDPATPGVGRPVTFTAVAAGTEPIVYAWDFGDGSGGSGKVISHVYAVSDTYTVVVTATNCYGTSEVVHAEDVWVSGAPDITVSPALLSVSLEPGGTTSRTLTIGNVGATDLAWSLVEDPDEDWLSVAPTSDTVPQSGNTNVTVGFSAVGLTVGNYNTTLRISSNDPDESPTNVPVTLYVASNRIFLPLVLKNS